MTGVWTTRLLVATVLVAGLVLDALLAAPGLPDPVEQPTALRAGATTCAALSTADGAEVDALTLTGPVPDALGDEQPTADLRTVADGSVVSQVEVREGVAATAVAPDLAAPLLALRWRAAPVVLGRAWQQPGSGEAVGGLVQGACPADADDRWFVPGVATAGGAAARLHLANPFDGTATARVSFTTPAGRLEPTRLQNVVVPARSVLELDLGEFAPEEPDLGVEVELAAGRVVVEAVQTLSPAIGGVEGVSLVEAVRSPSDVWTVPHVRVGGGTTAWLWVTNPGEVAADVRVSLQTADGPLVPPDGGVVVEPGRTERLDLGAVLPPGPPVGVTLRSSPEAPVVVSGVTVEGGADAAASGLAVVAGIEGEGVASPQAQLGARGGEGRAVQLHVVNPGTEPAQYDVVVVTDRGAERAPELQGLRLAPGARAQHGLAPLVVGSTAHAVLLEPSDGAVAGVLLSRDGSGSLDLVVSTLRPLPGVGTATPLRAVPDPGILARGGTPYGTSPAIPGRSEQADDAGQDADG